jgi:hypothetical protein
MADRRPSHACFVGQRKRIFDMHEIWLRFIGNFLHRVEGPLHFRFVLQPVMAVIFATIGGVRDAKVGKGPYFWSLFSDPQHRTELLKDGWKSIGKVFILAIVLDVIFQIRELHTVYPGEALIVALLLAIIPYLLVRGLVTRLLRPKAIHPSQPEPRNVGD